MSQSPGSLPTSSLPGLTLVNRLNAWMTSISTTFSGAAAPVTDGSGVTLTGQSWLDTSTAGYLKAKLFDGVSSIETGRYDATNHLWVPPIGGGTATIASAATTDLWSVPQAAVTISGTVTITAMASASAVPGTIKKVTFSGALVLTHNATSLILEGAANITTAAGDTAEVEAITSTNVRVKYKRASGLPVIPLAPLSAHTGLFNTTAGAAAPAEHSFSAILDAELGSTQGQIVYRGASAWTALNPGTAGQVLQTGGAAANPAWATIGGAMVLIKSQLASSSATIDFVNGVGGVVLDDTYDSYCLVISTMKVATDDVESWLRIGTGGAPTYQTANYDYASYGLRYDNSAANTASTTPGAASKIVLGTSGNGTVAIGNAAGEHFNCIIDFNNPEGSDFPQFSFSGNYNEALDSGIITFTGAGRYATAGAITAIRILCESGNIASGRFTLYGRTKA